MIKRIHHVAIICSNYEISKKFYTEILGLKILKETFRKERLSYKLDLAIENDYIIELFSFPDPPDRVSNPEAKGLRHLCFEVENIEEARNNLENRGILCEPIRVDELSDKKFFFFQDPDKLPIEFYEK